MLSMASTPRVLQIASRRLVTYFRHRTVLMQPLSYVTYYQNQLNSVQQIPRWRSSGVPMNSQMSSRLFLRCFASDHAGMTEKDLSNRVLTVVKLFDKVNPDKVTVESHFINDLGLDSLDTVEIVMAFEDEFGVEISDEEAEKIFSCKDAIDLLKVKMDVH